jgi:hypothetical protein
MKIREKVGRARHARGGVCLGNLSDRRKAMTDRYTKIILTVIAVCLIVIAVRDRTGVTPAAAQSPVHVVIDGVAPNAFVSSTVPVRLLSWSDFGLRQ